MWPLKAFARVDKGRGAGRDRGNFDSTPISAGRWLPLTINTDAVASIGTDGWACSSRHRTSLSWLKLISQFIRDPIRTGSF
ncbi:hypothetical protein EVAR_6633_1 [Eumeta japonica]|uniref:Uncharacterized protein n=1 Tax=Eumeta variegata TaxID=151549 RepID=A0A4C1TLQ0_EUMVA|nr:hypothetical protein EVAR_6633_1 [Eumeta japonica]